MKVGIIGASGKAGSLILKEAADRGHEVTAIVRNGSKVNNHKAAILEKSIFDLTAEDVGTFDAIINAFGAPLGEEQPHVDAGNTLIEALKGTDTRVLIVGGAASLYVDDAKQTRLFDTPDFPDEYKPTAKGQARNLEELHNTKGITWTFLSPSAIFEPEGKRTGSYRKGKDHLLVNSEGKSYISYADFAIAMVDELERAEHLNERFTVVGEAN